ncbi:MAG TPA: energy transducer TonB [Candidatus Binataceae bacterium]|nr:energy transducer TonB [Candidatus Binataceae bacterium]
MSASARIASPYFDQPWRRIAWVAPLSVLVWAAVLVCFSLLLEQTAPPAPELKPIEAHIIELPPVGGLQGGAAAAPAAHPAAPAPAKPKPQVEVKHHEAPVIHHRPKPYVIPVAPPSPLGIKKGPAEEAPPATSASVSKGATGESGGGGAGIAGGTGEGSGRGIGSDSAGARALYAPVPKIPDDLREDVFEAVAVAHFKISYEGNVTVSLATPTSNPRLNQILLETLKQWRFFPAMKNGVAIDSEFNVRIPISVQ